MERNREPYVKLSDLIGKLDLMVMDLDNDSAYPICTSRMHVPVITSTSGERYIPCSSGISGLGLATRLTELANTGDREKVEVSYQQR